MVFPVPFLFYKSTHCLNFKPNTTNWLFLTSPESHNITCYSPECILISGFFNLVWQKYVLLVMCSEQWVFIFVFICDSISNTNHCLSNTNTKCPLPEYIPKRRIHCIPLLERLLLFVKDFDFPLHNIIPSLKLSHCLTAVYFSFWHQRSSVQERKFQLEDLRCK